MILKNVTSPSFSFLLYRNNWFVNRLNNSNESGLLIYNKVQKSASTTMVFYLKKLAKMNNFVFEDRNHTFNTKLDEQVQILWDYYSYPAKLYCTDQHMMFINAVEDHGLKDNERPNWINMVREPITRLISEYYFFKKMDDKRRKSMIASQINWQTEV